MNLSAETIGRQMIEAAKGVVGDKWPTTKDYFESESKIYAARLATIVKMRKANLISEERARQHVAFQTTAWETVLLAVDGLSQLLVEQALNAAINVVRDAVNTAIGFALL